MEKESGTGWTKGKMLALVIPICLALAAVAVTMTLALGGGEEPDESGGTVNEEEMVEAYEEIKEEAEAALGEMEDIASDEAATDPEVYEQELEEAMTLYKQLLADLEDAAEAVVEVSDEYEELYAYIYEYYDYLYDITGQALDELEYLLSLVPTMQELQQLDGLLDKMEKLPAGGRNADLGDQVDQAVQKAVSNLEKATAPEALSPYDSEMQSLAQQLDSLAGQIKQGLAGGSGENPSSLADQMSAAVTATQQQLSATVDSLVSGYTSLLSQLEASVESLIP